MRFLITMTLLISPVASAAEKDLCETIGEISASIMTARQNSVPMSTLMKAVKDGKVSKDESSMMTGLIKSAYSKPLYSSEKNKATEISEFRNSAELLCYKNRN